MPTGAPGLNVTNVTEAIAWYVRVLGFTCSFVVPGDDPPYAIVERDGIALHLRKHPAAGTSFCYLTVEAVQRWYDEFKAAGASFRRHLETSPYGMRDCELLDCCGNRIGLGQPS